MDNSDPDLRLDSDFVCNWCRDFDKKYQKFQFTELQEKENLGYLASKLKRNRRGEYDSIIGLSGGVDSSYVAHLARVMGLNPLCVHFDNGWNSDIAVKNIRNIIDVSGFDLITYVIDWPEFRDLQRAFIKAGVIDIEMVTDHAIFASLFKLMRQHGIKTVLSGTNFSTEHGMPSKWLWNKMDLTNIKSIHKMYGENKLESFPTTNTLKWFMMKYFRLGGNFVEPLNMISYRKDVAIEKITDVFGWVNYGGKHWESRFTKFYQAYVLPKKFKVDKRKSHLSALVRNGEISRECALDEIARPVYSNIDLKIDKAFVLKKLGFSELEFDSIMMSPPKSHDDYLSDNIYIEPLIKMGRVVKRFV
jgi:N-acetyl sugar amidotransferase